jgi:hypothetical protein
VKALDFGPGFPRLRREASGEASFRPVHHAVQGFRRNDAKQQQSQFFTASVMGFGGQYADS